MDHAPCNTDDGDASVPLFTQRSFELLDALDKQPRREFYSAHKEEFHRSVEAPVQYLLRSVAAALPPEMTDLLETQKRLFGVIQKNDYGRGGAWPFYWGAFYPKGGERTKEIQLFVKVRPVGLLYGLGLGNYETGRWGPLVTGLRGLPSDRLLALQHAVEAAGLRFQKLAFDDDGEDVSFESWLNLAGGGEIKAVLPSAELVSKASAEVIRVVRDTFVTLLPYVQLSVGSPLKQPLSPAAQTSASPRVAQPPYTLDTLEEEAGFGRQNLETWLRILRTKRQIILQGPPGTGKTFLAQRLARVLVSETSGLSETVQFHPAYAYEDFIQGIRPEVREGGLTYKLEPGRFLDFCRRATMTDGAPCVLIIDEINRANLARVFGELMYLFEYRDGAIPLAAGGQTFRVPENVFLIGTMNTADRSIARMDYALRRRFAFIRLRPEYGVLSRRLAGAGLPAAALVKVLRAINQAIDDPNFELGISYFLRLGDLRTQIRDVWECEIEPYLEEYFYDRPKQVDAWRWSSLLEDDLREWA